MIDVNTVSRYPTHFLRAVELITKAREEFKIPSENWPNPIEIRCGIPCERYYAEVWIDGMDWQPSYWVIEEKDLDKPQIQPLIIFESNEERLKFHEHDFESLLKACLWYRRDKFWIKKDDLGYYTDVVWPFLHMVKATYRPELYEAYFEHASQQKVRFLINFKFIPKHIFGRKYNEDNRSDRNPQTGYFRSI